MSERLEPAVPEPRPEPDEATELVQSDDASVPDASPDLATPPATEAVAASADEAAAAEPTGRKQRFRRLRRLAHRKHGLLFLFLLIGVGGVIAGVGGSAAVQYSESASFCTKCHVMAPEKKAYELSPHKDVACGECHVRPGVAGFVSAKLAGTKELYKLVTSTYPRPILPPDHDELPPVKDTCLKCHSLKDLSNNGGPVKLVLRTTYQTDQANTRQQVAVVIRPAGLDQGSGLGSVSASGAVKGVHWHVLQQVAYTSSDRQDQTIDLVSVTEPDGSIKQFVSGSQANSNSVVVDIARLKSSETNRVMDCISCHNRVGHQAPSVDEAIDTAMANGDISPSLPFIKRDAVAVIADAYNTKDDADAAIEKLGTKYPIKSPADAAKVDSAVNALKRIYDEIATPAMRVTATTYANNLGHQSAPGCFRCHDGKHFEVVKGKITGTAIPSACTTCHTFPQSGPQVAGVVIGGRPVSHTTNFVFDHKNVATSVLPTGTACATCHVPTFCQNCHNSGAINLNHDLMLYRHAEASRIAGTNSCMYCHQTSSCTQCHRGAVPTLAVPARAARPPDSS